VTTETGRNASANSGPARALAPRAAITLAAIAAYYFAGFIPLPGVDPDTAENFLRENGATLPFQAFSGFMLGTVPMFSALIFAEVLMLVFPSLRHLKESPETQKRFELGVLIAALAIAAFQAWGMASALENITGLVPQPGLGFRLSCVVAMIGATLLIAWLATLITKYGLGHGFWLLFLTPLLVSAVGAAAFAASGTGTGAVSAAAVLVLPVCIAAAGFVLYRLEYANPGSAEREMFIWPVVLASAASGWLLLPLMFFVQPEQMTTLTSLAAPGQPLRLLALAVLIPAVTYMRFESVTGIPPETGKGSSPLAVALGLTAIMIAGDLLSVWSGLPAVPDAQALIILISVALAVWPTRAAAASHL